MAMITALTRPVSPRIADGERTEIERLPIDVDTARRQHLAYEQALAAAGCIVIRLPDLMDAPDGVFVEDTALVLGELAVIMSPGAPSRRSEVVSVAQALRRYRPLAFIEPPNRIDGGDVLVVGRTVFVGRSTRTDDAGTDALARIVGVHGYEVVPVMLSGCLHLKSAVTALDDETVLLNPEWVDADAFSELNIVEICHREPHAANVVRAGSQILAGAAFPTTIRRIERRGFTVRSVDVSEIAKAEGALTCCSLVFDA
jgi:dimethylargininase